ncbi:UNVERIFIED_CONTAM: hypothetical protein HDU68_004697, partial [Siphonaria sp. JEL0065]
MNIHTFRLLRSVVIPFPVTFDDNPNPGNPNKKKIDKTLKKRIKLWGPQMMLLLTEWYKDYTIKGLRKTNLLQDTTTEYAEDSNSALHWLNQFTVADETAAGFHLSSVFPGFCVWQQEHIGKRYPGGIKTFGKELRNGGVKTEAFKIGGINTTG